MLSRAVHLSENFVYTLWLTLQLSSSVYSTVDAVQSSRESMDWGFCFRVWNDFVESRYLIALLWKQKHCNSRVRINFQCQWHCSTNSSLITSLWYQGIFSHTTCMHRSDPQICQFTIGLHFITIACVLHISCMSLGLNLSVHNFHRWWADVKIAVSQNKNYSLITITFLLLTFLCSTGRQSDGADGTHQCIG